jgi:putative ABC transport system substrate-binding protein
MMDRLGFIWIFALGILAVPLKARGQPPSGKPARIGYLSLRSGPSYLDEAFQQGLRELGYVEGQNLSIEYRWADWKPERASALAIELVRLKVDVIVSTGGSIPATAAKKATGTIPVVFTVGDPVGAGLVTRLDRPGGNATGINILTLELNAKRLDLLKTAVPGVSRVAVLANPTAPTTGLMLKELERVARALQVKLQILEVRDRQELDDAFAAMVRERAEALLVASDPMFFAHSERIVDLAAKNRLPGIFEWREFAEAGGLLSYGTNLADMYRRLATYVDKILKGAKPGDLPIEQPTKFELVVNLKTAKALGVTIPKFVLDRADHVIAP